MRRQHAADVDRLGFKGRAARGIGYAWSYLTYTIGYLDVEGLGFKGRAAPVSFERDAALRGSRASIGS
jgi:hypothetical protein